jgi:hypothetical protein
MRVTFLQALALGVVVMLGSCGGDELPSGPPPPPSGPGFLQVLLQTPRSNDGALLITLSGGPLDSLQVSQTTLLAAPPGANDQRVIIAGDVRAGAVLRFWVPERANVANYRAVLDQVATRSDYIQQSLANYSLTITTD